MKTLLSNKFRFVRVYLEFEYLKQFLAEGYVLQSQYHFLNHSLKLLKLLYEKLWNS